MGSPGTPDQPLRVAIVGSGPSGFYAAGHLLQVQVPSDLDVQVDVYDRLPTPWGLVRGGRRARPPQHQGRQPRVREDRRPPRVPLLRQRRDRPRHHPRGPARPLPRGHLRGRRRRPTAGWASPARTCPGSWAATEFVAWYNGHPDYRDLEFDLSGERAVVIGNGNVAADVARMLALTRDELAVTDVADHALEVLRDSGDRGDRRARPPRAGAGRVHQPGAARARRDDRRRRRRRPARRRARRRSAAPGSRARRPT